MALAANGDTDKAAEHYQEAIRINPRYSEAHNDLGLHFYAKKDMDRALDELQQAVSYNPFYANARNNLGVVLYHSGKERRQKRRIAEAVEQFNEVLKLEPGHPLACRNLGNILDERGEVRQAIDYYQRALESKPDYPDAERELRTALAKLKDFDQDVPRLPVELATRLCQADGYKSPRLLTVLAAAQADAGKFPEAIETAEKALALVDSPQSSLAGVLRRHLESYRAGKPLPQ